MTCIVSKLKNSLVKHFCKEVKLEGNPTLFEVLKEILQLET